MKLLSAVAKPPLCKTHTQISKLMMTQKSWVQFQENKNESRQNLLNSIFSGGKKKNSVNSMRLKVFSKLDCFFKIEFVKLEFQLKIEFLKLDLDLT